MKFEAVEGTLPRSFAVKGSGEARLQLSKDTGPAECFFLKLGDNQSVCVRGREGDIDAGSGSARTVRLERMPGDQLLGDLKSSLIVLA